MEQQLGDCMMKIDGMIYKLTSNSHRGKHLNLQINMVNVFHVTAFRNICKTTVTENYCLSNGMNLKNKILIVNYAYI